MKIVHIAGCRPQFIKISMVDRELREKNHESIILHTGQHYDKEMSQVFFEQLDIPAPKINLGVGSHAEQVGKAMIGIEKFLLEEKPNQVLVYGDTNATLAGVLAACKLQIKTAHIEAGLRSFNRKMPEEINRVITDHCSDFLFCPTMSARDNLTAESIISGVYVVGDVMLDAMLYFNKQTDILSELGVEPKNYLLLTVHRASIGKKDLEDIIAALEVIDETVVFPVHPRIKPMLSRCNGKIKSIDPVSYFDMLTLEKNAKLILTDSGGVQKEAYFFGVPCITLRTETEWIETLEAGWNIIAGTDPKNIVLSYKIMSKNVGLPAERLELFGSGNAAKSIVKYLEDDPV